jgi:hypothetical protein
MDMKLELEGSNHISSPSPREYQAVGQAAIPASPPPCTSDDPTAYTATLPLAPAPAVVAVVESVAVPARPCLARRTISSGLSAAPKASRTRRSRPAWSLTNGRCSIRPESGSTGGDDLGDALVEVRREKKGDGRCAGSGRARSGACSGVPMKREVVGSTSVASGGTLCVGVESAFETAPTPPRD